MILIKNKNIKIKKIIIALVCALFFLAVTLPSLLVYADSNESEAKNTKESAGKEIDGSIVITDRPKEVIEFAENEGLTPDQVHESEGKPALVTLKENPGEEDLKTLDAKPFAKVVPNYVYRASFVPSDTNYSEQWNLPKISAPQAWDISKGNSNVTIAVIDSGVLSSQTINGTTYTQPDFPSSKIWRNSGESGNTQLGDACWTGTPQDKRNNDCDDDGNGFVDDWRGWDFMGGYRGNSEVCPNHNDASRYESADPNFVAQDNDPQPYSCDSPSSQSTLNKNHYSGNCTAWTSACYTGHGTMVASVAAAASNNGQLISGVDHNAKIMDLRALDAYGYTTTARIVAAINYAVDEGADVINMSLGSNCENNNFTDPTTESALAAAASAGIVSVAASGNEGMTNSVCYPASSSYVMAVGATDQNDVRRSYSNYSNKLDVVAPAGVPVANAPSAFINSNYYSNAGGTSLSTPHVAGLAALLKGKNSGYSRAQIINLIKNGTNKVSEMGGKTYHLQYGNGRINAKLSLAGAGKRVPVYRLHKSGKHFYTTSVKERNNVVKKLGYKYEGVAFWARQSSVNAKPVYRLYKKSKHFYTTSVKERNNVVKKLGYKYEGVAFYVLSEASPQTKPAYRLHKKGKHFYTTSVKERNNVVKKLGYKYEGVGYRAE